MTVEAKKQQLPEKLSFRSSLGQTKYLDAYDACFKTSQQPDESITFDTSFGLTHVHRYGNVENPPLFLLHGYTASSAMWSPNIEGLLNDFCVYTPDTIGDIGKSMLKPGTKLKSIDDLAVWLSEVLDWFGFDKVHLAGFSYGGYIAANFSIMFPEKVHRLVLISPAATFLSMKISFIAIASLMILPFRVFSSWMFYWAGIREELQTKRYKELAENHITLVYLGFKHFKRSQFLPNPKAIPAEKWSGFEVETLFLIGREEKQYNHDAVVSAAKQKVKNLEVESFDHASHDITFSCLAEVNQSMRKFFLRS